MKNRTAVLRGLVLFVCVSAWLGYAYAQKTAASGPRWEYMVFTATPTAPLQDQLNHLGAQGWELVCVQIGKPGIAFEPAEAQSTIYRERAAEGAAFYFKRPK